MTSRMTATREYKAAVARMRQAENVSEAAFVAASVDCEAARARLVAIEIAQPTARETHKRDAELRLRNRGLGH